MLPTSPLATPITEKRSIIRSPIHGDLNRNNLIYWCDKNQVMLIDFSTYQNNGHTLQDFAHIETQIVFGLMDRESDSHLPALDYTAEQLDHWINLQDHLYSQDLFVMDEFDAGPGGQGVGRAESLIRFVRHRALATWESRLTTDARDQLNVEYRASLLYYTLRSIAFDSLSPFKRLLAAYSSWRLLEYFDKYE